MYRISERPPNLNELQAPHLNWNDTYVYYQMVFKQLTIILMNMS